MFKKSIIVSTISFLLYNVLIFYIDFPVKPGHQWQENIIKAEDYIYEQNDKKTVIVGSSLAALLINNILPKNSYSLSFAGQSSFDGLEIIKKTGSIPNTVLIETNSIFTSSDTDFQNSLFMPIRSSLKKIFPALLEKNQPVCVLNSIIFWSLSKIYKIFVPEMKNKLKDKKTNDISGTENEKADQPVKNGFKRLMIDIAAKNYSQPPCDRIVKKQKKMLQDFKTYLDKEGIEIILFEMPVDERLMNSIVMEDLRKMIYSVFPPGQYIYLQPPGCLKFSTTDGIHLDYASASLYTRFLAEKIKKHDAENNRSLNKNLSELSEHDEDITFQHL